MFSHLATSRRPWYCVLALAEVVGLVDYHPRPFVLVEAGVAVAALLAGMPVLAYLTEAHGPRASHPPYLS